MVAGAEKSVKPAGGRIPFSCVVLTPARTCTNVSLCQLGLNIPLGYNARPGTWKAVVTDIASQTRSAVSFEVGD